jgi:hypothetical protein
MNRDNEKTKSIPLPEYAPLMRERSHTFQEKYCCGENLTNGVCSCLPNLFDICNALEKDSFRSGSDGFVKISTTSFAELDCPHLYW